MKVSELRGEMIARFEEADKRFHDLSAEIARTAGDLSAQMAAQHEETRRHFSIAIEQMKAERNLVLDQSTANADRLPDHERRITALERRK